MARLLQAGCETRAIASGAHPDLPDGGVFGASTATADTTVFRSGSASWKHSSGASNTVSYAQFNPGAVDGRSYFIRAYFKVAAPPTAAVAILSVMANITGVAARLRTDGAIELVINSVVQGSPSPAVTDGNWHRVELKAVAVATNSWNAGELVVDGTTVASASVTAFTRTSTVMNCGWTQAPGANLIINTDDFAVNDSTGTVNNGYPGDSNVVLLLPTADSAKGTGWTDDNASTVSLFPSVDNTPPVGIADTTSGGGGHQIRNATSNANVNYDATMSTYAAAGIVSGDTINAVVPWVITGAPVVTSAKLGTVGMVSNPAITNIALSAAGTAGAFWNGNAADTFAGGIGWKGSPGTVTERPTVTVGTAPVMRVTQTTASTRIAMVCFMGVYVDYTPAAAPAAAKPKRYGQSYGIAHRRAALR